MSNNGTRKNHSTPRSVEAKAKTEAEMIRSNAKLINYFLDIIENEAKRRRATKSHQSYMHVSSAMNKDGGGGHVIDAISI